MTSVIRFVWLLAAAGTALSGQRLLMYSEFQRVRPDGEVVSVDRVERRRELISPAVARNAFATWRIAVEAPPGTAYHLYIGQNPDDTAQVSLYQEEYARQGGEWVPHRVQPKPLPHSAVLSEGQKVQTYLLDVWMPKTTPVGRFRLEVQLNVGTRWVIYPLEIRVQEATVEGESAPLLSFPTLSSRSDVAVLTTFCNFEKPEHAARSPKPLDQPNTFVERNVRQDLLLAKTRNTDAFHALVLSASGFPALQSLCEQSAIASRGAEWWLRVRDRLYQQIPVP